MVLNYFEQELEKSLFKTNQEKTSIDKIMGRNDIERFQALLRKPRLTREDINVVTAYMAGMEAKLLNLSDNERSVLLKYFVWIEEFVKTAELNYDLQERIREFANDRLKLPLSDNQIKVLNNLEKVLIKNEAKIEHMFKFLANLYLNIARTSLSQGGAAFRKLLEQDFNIQYKMDSTNTMKEARA